MDKAAPRARIAVKVQPRARETALMESVGGAYKLRLAAPPVDGKANEPRDSVSRRRRCELCKDYRAA
jgi:uncharacterized protein YggU (UPF0235/DUF167 family)